MKLAEIFCDNMILQREKPIAIFGYGVGNGKVEFCKTVTEFESEDDKFYAYLPPQSAGGPYEMTVTLNGEKRVIKNILVGDVYLAGGQSNMEMTLKDTAEIEFHPNDKVRFFKEPNNADRDMNVSYSFTGWQAADGQNELSHSAIGYYVANYIFAKTNVPVGIVECNKGASRVEAWTAPEITESDEYKEWTKDRHLDGYYFRFNIANWLYLNKLLNVVPYSLSGVLWYQGESDRGHGETAFYADKFGKMAENWRSLWNESLPFYTVQLMPYNESAEKSDISGVRLQQLRASKEIDGVYLITLVETGEAGNIHPTHKKTVANCLANAVLNVQFGESCEYSGPVLESVDFEQGKLLLSFSHADNLTIKGEKIEDVLLLDAENEPIEFKAEVSGNSLVLSLPEGKKPVMASMGDQNAPKHNLYNEAGLLASPFRTKI